MSSLDLTKPINTEKGLIYLCVVGTTDSEYNFFLEQLKLKEGYGGQTLEESRDLIPIQDRMLAVIDAFDAIVDPGGTYQGNDGSSKLEKVINIVYANSHDKSEAFPYGGQFDPKVAYAFIVGFNNKFKNDAEFRDKWLEKEGMSLDADSNSSRIDTITSLLESTVSKFEEESIKATASQI